MKNIPTWLVIVLAIVVSAVVATFVTGWAWSGAKSYTIEGVVENSQVFEGTPGTLTSNAVPAKTIVDFTDGRQVEFDYVRLLLENGHRYRFEVLEKPQVNVIVFKKMTRLD